MNVVIQNQDLIVEINPLGAELVRMLKNGHNYIWEVDEAFWNKTSPILFPIVGRLKKDSYTLNGQSFHLPRHGFARNFNFEVVEKTTNSVVFSLKENEKTLLQYPFQFELQIAYTVNQSTVNITYTVKNNSAAKMPFSIGAHPAFAINANFEDYALLFEQDHILVAHELEHEAFSGKTKSIPLQNNQLPLRYSLFAKDAIVLKDMKSKYLTILKNNNPYLKVIFEDFPYLGIWTKPNAPFLCIEPWLGCADAADSNGVIFEKEGIQTLESNTEFKVSFSIVIL